MNAKNKISRSVLKVNCTYTIEDTVRFASLPFISILLHQYITPSSLTGPSIQQRNKRSVTNPQEIPINPKTHTHTQTVVVGLPDLPTYLPIYPSPMNKNQNMTQ